MLVSWDSILSDLFYICNRVRQGGILSPFLFAIYTDEVDLLCLKKTIHSDLTFEHNFRKSRPIFNILSLADSQGSSLCNLILQGLPPHRNCAANPSHTLLDQSRSVSFLHRPTFSDPTSTFAARGGGNFVETASPKVKLHNFGTS